MPIDLLDSRGALCDPHHLGDEAFNSLSLRASNMTPLSGAATYHTLTPSKEGRSDTVPGMNEQFSLEHMFIISILCGSLVVFWV